MIVAGRIDVHENRLLLPPGAMLNPPVAKKVYGVVMHFMAVAQCRSAIMATSNASVPEVTPTPNWDCEYAAISFSSPSTSGPPMNACASARRSNAARHSLPRIEHVLGFQV